MTDRPKIETRTGRSEGALAPKSDAARSTSGFCCTTASSIGTDCTYSSGHTVVLELFRR